MVMEKRIILCVVTICLLQTYCAGFEFSYTELDGETPYDVVRRDVELNGSYATLDDWPHWCLGNLSRCEDGIVIDIWVKFTEVAENDPGMIVFTSGGHNWYSNGVYFVQLFGNQYEFGVAYSESHWFVEFILCPDFWTHIRASWDLISGLVVTVDGARHEHSDADDRDFYQQMAFDAFMELTVGLNLDGTPHTEDMRYEISTLHIQNSPSGLDDSLNDSFKSGAITAG